MPEFLTIGEAADLLRIGRRALYEGLRRSEIAGAEKIDNQWCLRRDKLLRWVYESSGKVGQGREQELAEAERAAKKAEV